LLDTVATEAAKHWLSESMKTEPAKDRENI
jgi:hypothetical protein